MAKQEYTPSAEHRRILKRYLSRYFMAKKQSAALQKRLQDFSNALSATGEASPSPSEIEARIQAQAKEAERSVLEIMDVLKFLPPNSTERIILELRHLDCKAWRDICKTVYLTASPCYAHYNKGLDLLLSEPEVRHIIGLQKKAPRKSYGD